MIYQRLAQDVVKKDEEYIVLAQDYKRIVGDTPASRGKMRDAQASLVQSRAALESRNSDIKNWETRIVGWMYGMRTKYPSTSADAVLNQDYSEFGRIFRNINNVKLAQACRNPVPPPLPQ